MRKILSQIHINYPHTQSNIFIICLLFRTAALAAKNNAELKINIRTIKKCCSKLYLPFPLRLVPGISFTLNLDNKVNIDIFSFNVNFTITVDVTLGPTCNYACRNKARKLAPHRAEYRQELDILSRSPSLKAAPREII